MTFSPETVKALEAPLDPKTIKKPSGNFGPKGDYLEGWHVINELNRIFGFDGWSYRIDLSRDSLIEGQDSNGKPQWQAAYTCICTLNVDEVSRQDVGFGSGFAKSIGDAIEGATKEAATDALKRCARTFGNPFGLALYDKSRANVAAPAPPPSKCITPDQRLELVDLCSQTGVLIGDFLAVGNCSDIREVPANQFETAKAWIMDRAAEKQKENA